MKRGESGGSVHAEVWAAIPWCVAGTADADEMARVQAHLADCADCRSEWQQQQRLHDAMQLQAAPLPDAEAGLARVLARIDAAPLEQPLPAAAPRSPWRWVRVLAVASVVQAGLLALLFTLWWQRAEDPGYITLSQPAQRDAWPAGTAPRDDGAASGEALLQLAPRPELAFAELQALLQSAGLRVVSLQPDSGLITAATTQPAALVVERLRGDPRLLFVAPVDTGR